MTAVDKVSNGKKSNYLSIFCRLNEDKRDTCTEEFLAGAVLKAHDSLFNKENLVFQSFDIPVYDMDKKVLVTEILVHVSHHLLLPGSCNLTPDDLYEYHESVIDPLLLQQCLKDILGDNVVSVKISGLKYRTFLHLWPEGSNDAENSDKDDEKDVEDRFSYPHGYMWISGKDRVVTKESLSNFHL
jgi:hypothetical protein